MPFGGTGKWQVSNNGGNGPVWHRNGKEIFYWSPDNTLMSVPIELSASAVELGSNRVLARWNNPIGSFGISSPLDVSPDGKRFVVVAVGRQPSRPITLVANWTAELKQ